MWKQDLENCWRSLFPKKSAPERDVWDKRTRPESGSPQLLSDGPADRRELQGSHSTGENNKLNTSGAASQRRISNQNQPGFAAPSRSKSNHPADYKRDDAVIEGTGGDAAHLHDLSGGPDTTRGHSDLPSDEAETHGEKPIASLLEDLEKSSALLTRLRGEVRAERDRTRKAHERNALLKQTLLDRQQASATQVDKLRKALQEQRAKTVLANENIAKAKMQFNERSAILQERVIVARDKLKAKGAYYDAARKYIGIYRQGFMFDEIAKSDVDLGADAYLCLLPSSVPAGRMLSRINGGRVYCDSVENVEVDKHSLAPNMHPPALELVNLSAFGALTAVDGILTVGNALAKTLERFGPPVHVVPNFRSYEEPTPAGELREACGLNPGDRLLFASGNVVVGFEPVVRAMAALPSNIHLAAFVRIKPPAYAAEMQQLIRELNLEDRIHFFDFVEYSRLASLAADADVGMITSDVTNSNGAVGLPNRLFDYLTAGLPVIAPPMPDVVDIVRVHGFGRTLERVTTDNWVTAIKDVLENHSELKGAALRARKAMAWEGGEEALVDFLGNPRSVTMVGFRDISRYQRFLRIARTLTERGVLVKAVFLSDDPAPVSIPGVEFYYYSNRYGLGDGLVRVPTER